MSVQTTCFHCQHPNVFDNKWAGRVMRCQKCGGVITMPKPDALGVPAPAAPQPRLESMVQAPPPAARSLQTISERAHKASMAPAAGAAVLAASRAPVEEVYSTPQASAGPAAVFCAANGILALTVAAASALVALPATRAVALEKMHFSNPAASPQIACALAAAAVVVAGFYLLCAARLSRVPAFARWAAGAALLQTALQIALLLFLTIRSQLNDFVLAALTVSLIALCALVDFALRSARNSPAARLPGHAHVPSPSPQPTAGNAILQPHLT